MNDYSERRARCLYEELKYIYPDLARPDDRHPKEKKRDAEQAKVELFGPEPEKDKEEQCQSRD